jgi:DHA2 family methylenomycin A resistance protein-like MFS transporter
VLAQAQVGDDARLEHRHDVRGARHAVAGPDLLGDARAAEDLAALEHADVEAGAGQIGGGGQAVVAAADDDGVVTDDFVSLLDAPWRAQPFAARRSVGRLPFQGMARRRQVLVVMCAGLFLVQLDVSIVNVALPSIRIELHASAAALQWVVDGYAIALAGLMLAGGTVGDLHGHRRVVLAGLGLFGAASLAAGAAPGAGVLVAARVAQGAGAALLLPGTLAIIVHAFPGEAERARAIGAWAAVAGLSLPAGPLLGGLLVAGPGWRWVFLVNLPVVVAAAALTARLVRESADPRGRRLDRAGVVLGTVTLAAATFALIEAGSEGPRAPVVVAAAALAAAAGVAFVAVERRSPAPMLPPALFRRRRFTIANGLAGTMNLGSLGVIYVLTLFLQVVQGRSPAAAGLAVVPLFAPVAALAPLSGRLTGRLGPGAPAVAGLLVAAAGLALLGTAPADAPYLRLLPALLLWGAGLGLLTSAVVAAAVGAVEPERAGLASAVNNTARQAGGALGIAAFGALAGDAARPGFVHGFHLAALLAAGLYAVAAVPALALGRR